MKIVDYVTPKERLNPRFFVWWKEMNVEGVLLCVALFVIAVWL